MNGPAERCARTDAVLAVHLDGDYAVDERAPSSSVPRPGNAAGDESGWGWDFVCGESLREHLAGCSLCQRTLQRARRLDAALAAAAGRDVGSAAIEELARKLVERAVANGTPAADGWQVDGWQVDGRQSGTDLAASHSGAPQRTVVGVEQPSSTSTSTRGGATLREQKMRQQVIRRQAGRQQAGRQQTGRQPGPKFAGALLLAAGALAWWLLIGLHAAAPRRSTTQVWSSPTADLAAGDAARPGGNAAPGFSLEAARRFAGTHDRDAAPSRDPSPEFLAATLADRHCSLEDRITAGAQLAQLARTPARNGRECTEALFQALASCGDAGDTELELQRTLLAQLRSAPLAGLLVQRLQPLCDATADIGHAGDDLATLAALIVALRCDDDRIDTTLRRVVRARPDLDPIVCHGLRGRLRRDGGARLLLSCWQDRVATGQQPETPEAALHWFAGMPLATFAAVRQVLENSRSAPERVRCLLALGCVGDDSTTPCLLAHLRSSRQAEACAASAALATLPHSALRALLPMARFGTTRRNDCRNVEDALLRLALCRAGLDEATPWLATLELTERQLQQVRSAPLSRLAEVAVWFREGATIAD